MGPAGHLLDILVGDGPGDCMRFLKDWALAARPGSPQRLGPRETLTADQPVVRIQVVRARHARQDDVRIENPGHVRGLTVRVHALVTTEEKRENKQPRRGVAHTTTNRHGMNCAESGHPSNSKQALHSKARARPQTKQGKV